MSEPSDDEAITHDTLLRGRLKLLQPRRGFRSSLDPVLLAAFIEPPLGRFLDLGCATGALSFLLLQKDAAAAGVGVEIQPRLAELARRGRDANDFEGRFEVIHADVRSPGLLPPRSFDLVATNPPFRAVGSGNLPPVSERAIAHHEVTLALAEWLDIAVCALRPTGRLAVIFPYERQAELRDGLCARGLGICRYREVVSEIGQRPNRLLVEACVGAVAAQAMPPLVVHENRNYTTEVRRMLGEET